MIFATMKAKHFQLIILFSLLLLLGIALICNWYGKSSFTPFVEKEPYNPEPLTRYGIPVDSLIMFEGVVQPRETLSNILVRYKVSLSSIDQLTRRSRGIFDLRRIKAGNNYSVITLNDSLQTIRYFIYEETPTTFVVFDLGDSLHVFTGEKEIKPRIKETSGIIETSLWNAMIAMGDDPQLALDLSDIYAWTVDFFGIRRGDNYRVIYEVLYVDGQPIGIGKILASLFHSSGKDFYAFYLLQENVGEYFDEQANSLRKTFLKAPLRYSRISSHFSHRRLHPVHRVYRPHHGVDYAAPAGTPVMAVGDGMVTVARYRGANGNMIEIRHNSVHTTQYLHLSRYGKGIREGVRVTQGQVIGYVGSTGTSTGPHLDYRFYEHGRPINPLIVKSPSAEPVQKKYHEEFLILADSLRQALMKIELPAINTP
jgi:murein DD-endopeptidase MepM/ murein hydrolase activator NlpD